MKHKINRLIQYSKIMSILLLILFIMPISTVDAAEKGEIRAMVLIGDGMAAGSDELITDFLSGNTMGGYSLKSVNRYAYNKQYSCSVSDIDKCIDETFLGSTDKDICFFYYGGHGSYSKKTKKGVGLTLTDTTYYDYTLLVNKLASFKGKKYVILDCCYAGEIINSLKSLSQAQRNKFCVLTASGDKTTGLKIFKSGWDIFKTYQRFTYTLSQGVGTKGESVLSADQNNDGKVTLRELYDYVNNGINTSNPQYFGDDSIIIYQTTLKLNKSKAIIYTSGTTTLKLNAIADAPNTKIKWSSSNKTIATVNSSGKVTAKKAGTVTITAKAKGTLAKCTITVKKPSISLSKSKATIYTSGNKAIQLSATVIGANKTVTWSSSNKSVATINSKGKVTAKKAGTVTITAAANGLTATCKITVKNPSITLAKTKTVKLGSTVTLKATVVGASQKVTWKTSDKTIATVSSKGVISPKKTGKVIISATANGKTAKCVVTIKPAINLNESEETINKAYSTYVKKELISKGEYPYASYTVYDINGDGIPELFFEYMSGVRSGFKIYTYDKGVVNMKSMEGISRIYCNSSIKQICIVTSGGAANNKYTYYIMSGNKLKKISQYESISSYDKKTKKETVKYYENDKQISQKRFNAEVDAIEKWSIIRTYK